MRLFVCPSAGLFFAFVVDRVTLVGRCSETATLVVGAAERGAVFLTFCGRSEVVAFFVVAVVVVAVAAAISGKASSFSSSQSFVLFRFATGVLRGCPGGEISFAFSWAAAMCLFGVTGGNCLVRIAVVVVVVVVEASFISSSSAGGVAGAMTFVAAAAVRAAICCA